MCRIIRYYQSLPTPIIRSFDLSCKSSEHPKIVQVRLGHSDVSMTLNRYSHVTMDMQRQTADALDAAMGGTS